MHDRYGKEYNGQQNGGTSRRQQQQQQQHCCEYSWCRALTLPSPPPAQIEGLTQTRPFPSRTREVAAVHWPRSTVRIATNKQGGDTRQAVNTATPAVGKRWKLVRRFSNTIIGIRQSHHGQNGPYVYVKRELYNVSKVISGH